MNTQLKNKIMRRVYAVWLVKKVFSPVVVKAAILLAFIWQMTAYVSFGNVMANIPSLTAYNFYWNAFANTETISQLLALGSMFLVAWLVRDIYKNIPTFSILK